MVSNSFALARDFIRHQARLLERLLFAVQFEQEDPRRVADLVAAYQNRDGGLGYALEPDLRCSESQPLFVEVGLQALHDAGCRDPELALSFCAFLEGVSDGRGLVPILLPSALRSAHAPHWTSTGEPSLNPTAGICALLHYQGVRHPWLARATAACCELVLAGPKAEAHVLLSAARLVEHLPDRELAGRLARRVTSSLPGASFFIAEAPVQEYGLTPLHFADRPDSRWSALFSKPQVDAHLDDLAQRQQPDGSWPVLWDAAGPASVCEWRGRVTLEAIRVLAAYGRVSPDAVWRR